MTFRAWLMAQTDRRDRVGDLARDTAADRSCWAGRTAHSLRRHIEEQHGGWEPAMETVDIAWREWVPTIRDTSPVPSTGLGRGFRL